MAMKELSFTFEGAKYTLSFTRKTVQQMEQLGFSSDMVTSQPARGIQMLFRGAFLANHRFVKDDLKDRIFDSIKNKQELIQNLLIMYLEPINAMLEESEDDEKNVEWEVNF